VTLYAVVLGAALAAGPSVPPDLADAEVAGRAEAAFAEGVARRDDPDAARPHFETAAAYFDELRGRGASNPALYLDLGNASFLAGDLPRAVLAYRRGLRLAPADAGLRAALERARGVVNYADGGDFGRLRVDPRRRWLLAVPPGLAFVAAAVFYLAGWAALTRWRIVRRGRWLAVGLLALAAAAGCAAPVAEAARVFRAESGRPLVVIVDDGVLLRKGDGLTYPPRYPTPVNRGVEARLLHERGEWLQIELSGHEVGWIPREYALVDAEEGTPYSQ
jgi:hypothetical protein